MTSHAPHSARVIALRPVPSSAVAHNGLPLAPGARREPVKEPLWRHIVGGVLRRERLAQERTLKDVAEAARISMPYLSELERGRKEASSEVLAAAAQALGLGLADLLALTHGELVRLAQSKALRKNVNGLTRVGVRGRSAVAEPVGVEGGPTAAQGEKRNATEAGDANTVPVRGAGEAEPSADGQDEQLPVGDEQRPVGDEALPAGEEERAGEVADVESSEPASIDGGETPVEEDGAVASFADLSRYRAAQCAGRSHGTVGTGSDADFGRGPVNGAASIAPHHGEVRLAA